MNIANVILSAAKNLRFNLNPMSGEYSEMFRFAQHDSERFVERNFYFPSRKVTAPVSKV